MATTKPTAKKANSELKRKRQSAKRQSRNTSILSKLKTEEKKLRTALAAGTESVKSLYQEFSSALDKAAKNGVIHKNAAARKKSRLNTRLVAEKSAAPAKVKKSGGAKAVATKARSKAAKTAKTKKK